MIGLELLAAHMAGDYLFQDNWMATNKLTNRFARAVHVSIYCLCFLPVVLIHWPGPGLALLFFTLLWVAHWLTDSKRWRTSNPWPAMPILHDQSLHVVQLAVLGWVLV